MHNRFANPSNWLHRAIANYRQNQAQALQSSIGGSSSSGYPGPSLHPRRWGTVLLTGQTTPSAVRQARSIEPSVKAPPGYLQQVSAPTIDAPPSKAPPGYLQHMSAPTIVGPPPSKAPPGYLQQMSAPTSPNITSKTYVQPVGTIPSPPTIPIVAGYQYAGSPVVDQRPPPKPPGGPPHDPASVIANAIVTNMQTSSV